MQGRDEVDLATDGEKSCLLSRDIVSSTDMIIAQRLHI
jgi:hypothetical protein